MSSEGSSRLRQFGLYKTIDSQTAEFLKLSRKRQIRRGCACAAVSTAITVTVVVVTLLIYEFGFRTDYKPTQNTLRKLSWMDVVNDSNVFDKYHHPLKNNGKLLALILKSLDQKRYLENIVEESSLKPSHKQTTYSFKKDSFSDAKNRIIPGYKPSRLLPNRRKDGIAKARKIIDYQRVITYLNSMSFTENTDETTPSGIHIGQNSQLKTNFTGDMFHQDHQASKAEIKRSENNKFEPKMVPAQSLSCKCPYRGNLTEILEKLYKSIQQLQKVTKVKSNDNKTNKKHKTAKALPIKIKKIKYASTTIFPNIRTATNAYSPIFNIRNNNTFESEISIIEEHINEKNTESNLFKTHKDVGTDTKFDDVTNVYIQTLHSDAKPTNNSTNENSSVSDVTVKYTQMTQKELYDFDDKLYNITPGSIQELNTSTGLEKINNKKNSEFNDFENYLNGLSKLKTLIVNKPQTLSTLPAAFVEDPKIMQWDFKHFLNHEIGDPIKRVSIPTEGLYENKQKKLPYQITKETPVIYKYKSGASLKENDEKPKPTSDFLVNGVDENIPLTPMMQSFLLSKKENGIILSLDEITTISNKLQREDSSEDLPFHLRFFEDEEKFISLKAYTSTPTSVLKKDKKKRGQRIHDSIQSSQQKARKNTPVNVPFDEEDEYLSNNETDTATPTKAAQHSVEKAEHVASLNTHTTPITKDAHRRDLDISSLSPHTQTIVREAQKRDMNINRGTNSLKPHTETTSKDVKQHDLNGESNVNSLIKGRKANVKKTRTHDFDGDIGASRLRTHTKTTATETQKYDINGDKYAWRLWREEKLRDSSRENVNNIKHSPKKSTKIANEVPRIQLSTRKLLKPTEAPTTEHKRSKIKEIFYMTGDETPVDDFETKLSSLMYFKDTPINYTALANSFINKADSASIEISKSMMPETRPSNLEIRRNPDLNDYYPTNWYTNDNNDEPSVFSFNF